MTSEFCLILANNSNLFFFYSQEDEALKTNEAFSRQLGCRQEMQHVGAVGLKVYKSYFNSVENLCLVVTVIALVIAGQIAISAVDLFVSKW